MLKRLHLRRCRSEKQVLEIKVRDHKLPQWVAHRDQLIALTLTCGRPGVRSGLMNLAAARRVGCAKNTAYCSLAEFNQSGSRNPVPVAPMASDLPRRNKRAVQSGSGWQS